MAEVKIIEDEAFWLDPQGRFIKETMLKDEDRARDQLIEQIATNWKLAQRSLIELKEWIYEAVGGYLDELHNSYGLKKKKKDGGVILRDYSGRFKLQIQVANVINFDERLQVAKTLIDRCIERWSKGADSNLVTIINDAFKVNQQGKVSIPRILGLRRLPIVDEEWKLAMEAISDSLLVEYTKKYIRLYEREDLEQKYVAIPLDIAAL